VFPWQLSKVAAEQDIPNTLKYPDHIIDFIDSLPENFTTSEAIRARDMAGFPEIKVKRILK
jgi:hypothetical protein